MANSEAETSNDAARALGGEYQVFLNFRGLDTRHGFTDFLYHGLVDAGVCVFKEDDELHIGENLLHVINNSILYIPIFSRTYASSKRCLQELALIVDNISKSKDKKHILPIFLDVEPEDVKLRTQLYSTAIEKHQEDFPKEVQAWRHALAEVDEIEGWNVKKDQRGLKVLIERRFIKILENDKIWMHDQVIDLGRRIVRQESPFNPGRRSRLWIAQEALEIIRTKKIKDEVQALKIFRCDDSIEITNEEFERLQNLRFLELNWGTYAGDFARCNSKLRWFSWHSPRDFRADNMYLDHLVVCKLDTIDFKDDSKVWDLIKRAQNLKVLSITRCSSITTTPNFSKCSSLERLTLADCFSLKRIESFIGDLGSLIELKIEECKGLTNLPEELGALVKLEHFSLSGCRGLRELPSSLGNLTSLRKLDLSGTSIAKPMPFPLSTSDIESKPNKVVQLKVIGIWSGAIEVELDRWTVPMLQEEVARQLNLSPDSINLTFGSNVLKDGDGTAKLSELGVKGNAEILSTRVCVDQGKSLEEEDMANDERSCWLARVKAAATALAKRHAGEGFNVELEAQDGKKVNMGSETDQRAVMMGLMLHSYAKQLIRRQKYEDALEILAMGEKSFSHCNPHFIEMVDNVPILQLDTVWCYLMLRDISSLSVAGIRLQKAREGIECALGKDYSRVRRLQGGLYRPMALHLRLELLEGVVAYYSGHLDKSRKALTSAQEKFLKVHVPDESLSLVTSEGFEERDARRVLRMTNLDVGSAIDFLIEEEDKKVQKHEEDMKQRQEISEQESYGVTPMKKPVDLQRLNELVSTGFEKALAAEALRRNENDTQKALDDLTNPETNAAIQNDIEQRKSVEAAIEQLVSLGFERSSVVQAVSGGRTVEQAMQQLLEQPQGLPNQPENADPATSTPATTSASSINDEDLASTSNIDEVGDTSAHAGMDDGDEEMEKELAIALDQVDAISDDDIVVTEEGKAIEEYLSLLASAGGSSSETQTR
ncbi:hypothetical protein BT93_C1876 [Corymbia citriodora subsp. variegata]|nr:hypothetical protein BT93_C1876 [Corymbia citriodora subsp. variegata]